MVPGTPYLVALLLQVVTNKTFEVIELPVRHEDRGVGSIPFVANVQELDSRALTREAFERQLDVRKALELDLEPEAFFEPHGLLGFPRSGRIRSKRLELPSQRATVSGSITLRNRPTPSALLRRSVGLRLGHTLEDEVPLPLVSPIGHAEAAPLPYAFLLRSLLAIFWRSSSIARISASRIRSRSWISASFKTSSAARVTSA